MQLVWLSAAGAFFTGVGAATAVFWIYRHRNLRPILEARGKVSHVAELTSDISALKAAEKFLEEARSKAEETNLAKSQFLANVSHEIRTPLAAISGYSELLLNSELACEEIDHAVLAIRRNSDHLLNLVNEILDLSKVEAGKIEFEQISVEPTAILNSVFSVVSATALEKGVRLNIIVDPKMPKYISTDPTRLRQILINVVGNAVKFTESGSVTVLVKSVAKDAQGSEVRFVISDTGIGIPTEQQEKLFVPFAQSDSSATRKFGGTGLGLALSRKLARALGGDVSLVHSSINSGSEFLISVDGGSQREQVFPVRGDDKSLSLHGVKILAVDDSADNRDLIRAFLKSSGAEVTFAENGCMGVEFAMNGDFNVVLMDIQMPGLDGHAATRQLRKMGYRKPILALTAHAFMEDRHLAFASGFDDHLTKPIARSSLYKAIRRFADKNDDQCFENAL